MKTCPKCGKQFKNLGSHMKKYRSEKDGVQERVQKAEEKPRPKRPLERFGNQRVFHSGQYGVRVINRGN